MDNQPFITIKTPLFVAKWSFIIGTIILLGHLIAIEFGHYSVFLIIGLFYVYGAIAINITVFITSIVASFWYRENQRKMVINSLIQLFNIPVAILYFNIVFP